MSDAAQPVPIPIDEILVSERRRSIGDVSELADSIRELGLLNPITVTLDKKLVVGGRRLAAVKQLGWCEIRAFVKAYGALHAELAEIDENLMRLELTRLEHSEQMARRKEIYEALHPEAARPKGGRPAGNAEPISTFADDTAKKTGVTPRTVRQEVQIANDITPEAKDLIRETEAANSKTDLLALARVKDASAQKAVAQKVASGEAKSVVQAMRQYSRETRLRLGEERSRLTEGQYDVIYADPPWQYEQEQCKGTSLDHYPTMALAEICALEVNGKPVRELAAKDAVLFL